MTRVASWPEHRTSLPRAAAGWVAASATTALALTVGAMLVLNAQNADGRRGEMEQAVLLTLAPLPSPAAQAVPDPAPETDSTSPPAPDMTPPEPDLASLAPAEADPDVAIPALPDLAQPAPDAAPALADDAPPEPALVPLPKPRPVAAPVKPKTKPKAQAHQPPAKKTAQAPAKETATRKKTAQKPKASASTSASAPSTQKAKAGTKGQTKASAASYDRQVLKRINGTKRRSAPSKGVVVVGFKIAGDGSVASVTVIRGSGSPDLDRIATDHIRRAGPFPPPPAGARRSFSFEFVGRG